MPQLASFIVGSSGAGSTTNNIPFLTSTAALNKMFPKSSSDHAMRYLASSLGHPTYRAKKSVARALAGSHFRAAATTFGKSAVAPYVRGALMGAAIVGGTAAAAYGLEHIAKKHQARVSRKAAIAARSRHTTRTGSGHRPAAIASRKRLHGAGSAHGGHRGGNTHRDSKGRFT